MASLRLWAAVLAISIGATPSLARPVPNPGSQAGEIVVTAERRISEYDPQQTPHVTLTRRADNLITEVRVVCDTREPGQRREELKQTLRAMIRAAGASHGISLGLGDEVVGAFDETMLDSVIEPDTKTDTSVARVVIKTPVSATDSFDSATARVTAFIKSVPKAGRTEVLRESDWNLTIVGPERNRSELLRLIAEDAKASAAQFGPGYGFVLDGLQHPIAWYQEGPLDLALYISYKLQITPMK
ncbi:hypothetical protein [Phenylobacterium montanum]|uniref:TonB-dependent receptor n=1 Tax=Phenylobacterium montanum TaxID=2823693 RepID=A0A975FZG3_9CAUL|nr:hypothetical protein [Caulobacter sp. S6]QUD87687.1 hypothetical protein KCG34_21995 [Caulobacter sp. S6]